MKNNQTKIKKSVFDNNRFVLAISLIFAIVLWITVSPERSVTVNYPINITTENTSAGELGLNVIEGQAQNISIRVEGKWYVIGELDADDFIVSYSLSGITKAGEYDVMLTASKASTGADYNIVSVEPSKVKVKFDFIKTAVFAVEVKADEIEASEDHILGAPVIDSGFSTIEISGPLSIIDSIARVEASVDANETLSTSKSYTAPVKLYDAAGKEIDTTLLTLPFNEVDITVPIHISKEVPIKATFKNAPAAYVDGISYSLNVSKVKIKGTKEVIDGITEVTLDVIDFSQLSPDNNKFKFTLNLPTGVEAIDDIPEITVTVNIKSFEQKSVDVTKFTAVNTPSGMTVTPVTSKKAVTLVAPSSVIDSIKAGELYLEYDMSGKTAASGEMVVDAFLKSSKYNNIWGYGTYQIQVKVNTK